MTSPVQLEVTKRTEAHPKTGELIQVTEFRRGALGVRRTQFKDLRTFLEEVGSESTRESLEKYCNHLRDFLHSKGLPSDRQPLWLQYNDGPWQEKHLDTMERPKPGESVSSCLWTKRLEEMTEELSPERLAGNLLWDLTQLLKRPGIDEHLWHIVKYANSSFNFRMCGRLNQLADRGAKARSACAAGPKAKRAKAVKVAKVIMDCANEHWTKHPGDRDIANTTATAIRDTVNSRLRAEQLLSKRSDDRSAKTIGDYIRRNT